MQTTKLLKNAKPRVYKKAKSSAAITTIERRTEKVFGLPENSVRFVYPGGKRAPDDATIEDLRTKWNTYLAKK